MQYVSSIYTFTLITWGLGPFPITKFGLCANTQATASDIPIYNIFVPQKVPFSKVSDDVIPCDLWFAPHPIKNPGYACAPKYCYGIEIGAIVVLPILQLLSIHCFHSGLDEERFRLRSNYNLTYLDHYINIFKKNKKLCDCKSIYGVTWFRFQKPRPPKNDETFQL